VQHGNHTCRASFALVQESFYRGRVAKQPQQSIVASWIKIKNPHAESVGIPGNQVSRND